LLIDIFEHAQLVQEEMKSVTREAFDADMLFQLGIAHALQIVGEAARQLTDETRVKYPTVPWRQVVGMRHRLVHDYFRVDMNRVWDTVRDDIPALIDLLRPVVQPLLDEAAEERRKRPPK